MKTKYLAAAAVAAFALATAGVATAQTTSETKTSTDVDANGAKTTKVEHIRRHKTHHAKRILGVKVGHKTRVSKTVHETKTSPTGDKSTTVKTSSN